MNCNCNITELVLGILILVFTLWITDFSGYIVAIAAVILIMHALLCKKSCSHETSMPEKKQVKKKRR